MTTYKCRRHGRRDCSTCRTTTASSDSGGYDAATWVAVSSIYDSGSSYSSSSSDSSGSSGGGCGGE